MPIKTFQTSVPANGSSLLALAEVSRFGGRGGHLSVRSTVPAASSGSVLQTVMIGTDSIEVDGPVFAEPVVGGGPSPDSYAVTGGGIPGDPITIKLTNTTGGAIIVRSVVDVRMA